MIKYFIIYCLVGLLLMAGVAKSYVDDGKTKDLTQYGPGALLIAIIVGIIFWPVFVVRTIELMKERKRLYKLRMMQKNEETNEDEDS